MENLEPLLNLAQKGDKHAFAKIYNLFMKRIYRYCFLNLGNSDKAEDICQETFIKAWKSLPTFSNFKGGSFQAYLFKIARNSIIDLSRKKKEVALDQALEVEAEERVEEGVDRQEKINQVRGVLSSLKEEERHLISLRFFEELSFTEISQVLEIKEGALRVKTHRVLKKLKDLLQGNYG